MKTQGMTLKDLVRDRKEDPAEVTDPALQVDMRPIQAALDEPMDQLDETNLGRHRLIQALTRRYGEGYKLVPAAMKALAHYDKEADVIKVIKHNRRQFRGR